MEASCAANKRADWLLYICYGLLALLLIVLIFEPRICISLYFWCRGLDWSRSRRAAVNVMRGDSVPDQVVRKRLFTLMQIMGQQTPTVTFRMIPYMKRLRDMARSGVASKGDVEKIFMVAVDSSRTKKIESSAGIIVY
jgi:hypothetical protein